MSDDFKHMDPEQYARLYARFFDRSVDEILLASGMPIKGRAVLDLCCGGMRVALRAEELGACSVSAVDASKQMMGEGWYSSIVEKHISDISQWRMGNHLSQILAYLFPEDSFDLAICQQGVNYWWGLEPVRAICHYLKPGGYFVFNTFAHPPSAFPRTKSYKIGGRDYTEVTWRLDDLVVHVQTCDRESHLSTFRWIGESEFLAVLEDASFVVDQRYSNSGRSVMYVARKMER